MSTEAVTYSLLRHSTNLPKLIEAEGYMVEYVGDRAVETDSRITLSGVPGRQMGETEQEFFEKVARSFLSGQLESEESDNDSLSILAVSINGQNVSTSDMDVSTTSLGIRDDTRRRLEKASANIDVKVTGKYRPPPLIDFGELVEDSINRDRSLLEEELKKPAFEDRGDGKFVQTPSSYFQEVEVKEAKEIKKRPLVVAEEEEDGITIKNLLNFAAMGVGGLIFILSSAFFLRPHRRQTMFRSRHDSYQLTHPINVEADRGLIGNSFSNSFSSDRRDSMTKEKSRRGWNDPPLDSSANSFRSGQSREVYDPRTSRRSAHGGRRVASSYTSGQSSISGQGSYSESFRSASSGGRGYDRRYPHSER